MQNRRRELPLSKQETLSYSYKFKFLTGEIKEFTVNLDPQTLNLIEPEELVYPKWAKLKNFKCPNCTLDAKRNKYCPVAVNMNTIIEAFRDSISYEMVEVFIETQARNFFKHTSLQEGINSIIGICMVTSGCPILSQLKPMVKVHVPFSSLPERKYKVLSMYLMGQYFVKKRGGEPDWDFNRLVDIFESVRIVNKNFCEKLSQIKIKDATINALITLDSFAFYTSFFINKNMLNAMEPAFNAYVDQHERRKNENK